MDRREALCRSTIQKWLKKFELLGQIIDVKNKTRARHSKTTDNITAAPQSVEQSLSLSIPRRSLELGKQKTSLQ